MTHALKEAARLADCLHFEEALKILQETADPESKEEWNRLMARVLRGLYHSEEGCRYAREAGSDPKSCLELAKCLFADGKIREAGNLLQSLDGGNPSPDICFSLAAWLAETGDVEMGLDFLHRISVDSLPGGLLKMDCLVLSADLASFQEKTTDAFQIYNKALDETAACVPYNWQPLRRMLIIHNMADTMEQLEQPDEALCLYQDALREMEYQKQRDPHVTDLAGYELELLLSVANCYGNAEEFDTARQYLSRADSLLADYESRQLPYFKARRIYMEGLLQLNEGNDSQAADAFRQALDLQRDLCRQGRDKPEHAARSAYYLASVLSDAQSQQKLRLYAEAWPVFEKMSAKEPSFYLASLADIENERGRLSDCSASAQSHYLKAEKLYEQLLTNNPEDCLARESLLTAKINLFLLSPDAENADWLKSELLLLKKSDPNRLFLHTVTAWLHNSPDCPLELQSWLSDYLRDLGNPYDA